MSRFIVTPKKESEEDKTITISLRMDKQLQKRYDELAARSKRSRNELMIKALEFALDNLVEDDDEQGE